MMSSTDLGTIRNAAGEALEHVYLPASGAGAATVVIGHGVTANMDREWARVLASALHDAGFGALRFSFSGNGGSEGSFLDSCPTKEVGDARAVLDALERVGVGPLVFVGHSMGAAAGVLLMSGGEERVIALVSLAGMVHTEDFVARRLPDCKPGQLMWDTPGCEMGQVFLDDISKVHSVLPLAKEVRVPWLLVHGSADPIVPPSESEEIKAAAGATAELVILDGADHSFTGGREAEMARVVVKWLERLG